MINVMLDLETMGKNPNAPIIAIGAVTFDRNRILSEFYRSVDLTSSIESGGIVDGSTIDWWLGQSDDARRVTSDFRKVSINDALRSFSKWMPADSKVWGNGSSFDNVILRQSYIRLSLVEPWGFWNDRCYRTIASGSKIKRTQLGTHHNALDDAKSQALHLIEIWRTL